ncbi:MAG: polysaccharide deacetylase family protein [Firmicutes bacterium]|nr:polysaccharide deacetylase family protein [Bacillota bacterium]
MRAEIFTSRRLLKEKTKRTVTAFAYPFGRYNPHTIDLVKAAGYTTARIIRWGSCHTKDDLLTLTGYLVPNSLEGFLTALKFQSPFPD